MQPPNILPQLPRRLLSRTDSGQRDMKRDLFTFTDGGVRVKAEYDMSLKAQHQSELASSAYGLLLRQHYCLRQKCSALLVWSFFPSLSIISSIDLVFSLPPYLFLCPRWPSRAAQWHHGIDIRNKHVSVIGNGGVLLCYP